MPFFMILIVVSFVFYMYLKVKYVRSKRPMERKWISSKSSICLGSFVLFFGINQWFIYETSLSLIIGILFVLFGSGSILAGIKAYKYYQPYAIKEADQM
ncbi:YtpI family protein [Priestia megaterium]|uniref:YtpI family protein n=1 Tax=Priestia megaterium TaxID=1404 RepID=UPI003FD31E37